MKKLGEIVAGSKTLKAATALTPHVLKLLNAAQEIRSEPDAAEAAFMARQLVQCTLPHANPGNVGVWSRSNGNLTLGIQQGYDLKTGQGIGYPFGSIPRLLLFWITTEAVQTKTRRLELGKSLSAFMRDIGLDPNTGGRPNSRVTSRHSGNVAVAKHLFPDTRNSVAETWRRSSPE
jgi:hypothetical protein